jgi:hypothetical protein
VSVRRPLLVFGALVLVALAVPFSARATSAAISPGRLGIGDSVMLGAKSELNARGIRVNAAVSRQFDDGIAIVRSMAAAGTLPSTVIVHLGNNGVYQDGDCGRLVRAAGAHRSVWLVTLKIPRWWRARINDALRRCAANYARAHLIDWYAYAHDHPRWFYDDGYHLNGTGRVRYARLIASRTG